MPQRRPDRMTDDELFNDWLAGIERISTEMIALGQNRRTFKMMREVVDRNQHLQETGGHVIEWMFGNYALAAAMSFRRELDRAEATLGLFNLLHEIEERPTILNRARYRAMWNFHQRDFIEGLDCDRAFNTFDLKRFPDETARDHIDPAMVRADRERLDETEKVRLFVEQTFAHRARGTPQTVTWREFHEAVEMLVEVFKKYYLLLTQKTVLDIEPAAQYDTHECLTFPWSEVERRDQ